MPGEPGPTCFPRRPTKTIGRLRRCQPSGAGRPAPTPRAPDRTGRGRSSPLAGQASALHPEQVVALAPGAEQDVAAVPQVVRRPRRPLRVGPAVVHVDAALLEAPAGLALGRRQAGLGQQVAPPSRPAARRLGGTGVVASSPSSSVERLGRRRRRGRRRTATADAASAAAAAAGPWTRSVTSRARRRWPSRRSGAGSAASATASASSTAQQGQLEQEAPHVVVGHAASSTGRSGTGEVRSAPSQTLPPLALAELPPVGPQQQRPGEAVHGVARHAGGSGRRRR